MNEGGERGATYSGLELQCVTGGSIHGIDSVFVQYLESYSINLPENR